MESRAQSTKDDKKEKTGSIWTVMMYGDAVDKLLMIFGFVGAVGDGMSLPATFLVISKIMNSIGNEASSTSEFTDKINQNALNLFYMACWRWVVSFLEGYCWTRTGERQASTLRIKYLKAVLRQDIEYFELNRTFMSDAIASVSSDSLIIQDALSEKIPSFIVNSSTFFSCYIVGFLLAGRLALVAFPTAILLVIPGLMYGRMLTSLTRKVREEYNKASAIVEQAISSVRTVYSFVGERKTLAEFSAALRKSVKLGLRQGLLKGIAIGSQGITFAIWAFMAWYASQLVVHYGGKGGNIFSVGASIILGGLSLGSGLSNVKYISEASSAGERMIEVMRRVPKIDSESMEGEIFESVLGEVEFKGVEFSYPLRPTNLVLRDFNLRVPRGKTLALVGGSGSGKSTVIALMERFYDPDAGEILLDGVDIRKLQLNWLRWQMGLVSQEPTLFATSIKENILFGKEDASMDEVVAAAKASNAHTFISQLPSGYETQVGERGLQVSGGQKQRIAIARALLKSPKILLLDEATSALDSESESIVQEALNQASIGRTTIVIAHRLSTIRNSNVIAVVREGQIVETGSHNDLICNEDGLYSSLIHTKKKTRAREEQEDSEFIPSPEFGSKIGVTMSKRVPHTSSSSKGGGGDTLEPSKPKLNLSVPSFQRLLMLNAPEWKQALLGCLSSVVFGGIQPVYALVNGSFISVYFQQDHNEIRNKARIYSLIFTFLSVLSFLANIGQYYNFGAMGEYLTKRVREQMLSKMLTFEVGWFDRDENSTGAICSQLANDANVVRSLVGDQMALLIHTLSAVTIAWTMGLVISWRLAIVMIVIHPLCIVCYYTRKVLLKSMSSTAIKAQADSSTLAAEAVSNIRAITAFSSQGRILHFFNLCQEGPRHVSIRQAWYTGIGLATSQSLITCNWAFDFWYGGKLISQGYLSSKALFQTVLILATTARVIADAGSMTTDLARGSDTVASVFAILDQRTSINPEDPDGHQPNKIEGCIEISNIDFAYPARPEVMIFRRLSLNIGAGKSTALVGQSGSGKSTIIGLIERFYDPLCGMVKIDGRDIRSYNLRFLRQHIALVGQEPTLFSGNIRENITYGSEGATEAEIEAAARSANAHDFISILKDGYNTWCGERGIQLSGGQKQRVAIARAILKNPAILLLDEATSALDNQSEKLVQEALKRIMVGRTSVVVAHRLSTIQDCDLIVVLEKGEVVEKGTHSSLLAKGPGGSYYGLVRLQQRG